MAEKEEENLESQSENGQKLKYPDNKQSAADNKDEIDLIELFLAFWKEKKILYYSVVVFIIIGLIVAFTSPEEYTAEVRLLPEGRQQSASISLAQQFGLGQLPATTSDGISTRFYPDIVHSFPFLIIIMDYKIYDPELNDTLSLFIYFNEYHSGVTFFSRITSFLKKYTIRLPFTIASWLTPKDDSETIIIADEDSESEDIGILTRKNVITLNNQELKVINLLRQRITVSSQDGIITISSKMPDPGMAADITEEVTNSLVDFIKSYRTEKARTDVEFIEDRYEEARLRFENSQERLAQFRDQNRGQLTQMARTHEQRLQSEYDLAFNVYNTLARRLEEARLKLQEETPVVQVLEPAIIPTSPSEPRREFILTKYLVMGIIAGFGLIFAELVKQKIRDIVRNKRNDRFS